MLQSHTDIQHMVPDMSTGPFFDYNNDMGPSLAELVDLSSNDVANPDRLVSSFPADPKPNSKRLSEKPQKQRENPFSALYKNTDPSYNPVFWVPAQLHPEIAPNEFNNWIEKRASALNVGEKRATRRKSILSLHSFTSEQLNEKKPRSSGLAAPPTELSTPQIPLSPSLIRRHTYNNNRSDLLVKKEKDEFIVVPKTDTAGLKRSARAKPRKEVPGKSTKARTYTREPTFILPSNDMIPHRKTISEPIIETEEESEAGLLNEINHLLSTKIIDDKEIFEKTSTSTYKDIDELADSNYEVDFEKDINRAAADLFDYFDAPVLELTPKTSPVISEQPLQPKSFPKPKSKPTPKPIPEPTPEPTPEPKKAIVPLESPPSTIHKQQSPASQRSAKKGFSWFWNNDSEDSDKKSQARESSRKKSVDATPSHLNTRSSTKTSQSLVAMNKPSALVETTKSKGKDKPKKISFFFLGKDKKEKKRSKDHNKQTSLDKSQESEFGSEYTSYDPCDLPQHVEQHLYRLSHHKLANPKRPLAHQVVISNMMLAYLRVVNPNFRAPQARSKNTNKSNNPAPKPRSPHLISKERYKHGRHVPMDSSSEEEEDTSLSDSSSDDDDAIGTLRIRRAS